MTGDGTEDDVEMIPVPQRRKLKRQRPYHLSGVAKFFMILGGAWFLALMAYEMIAVYNPPEEYYFTPYGYVRLEYPESLKNSVFNLSTSGRCKNCKEN